MDEERIRRYSCLVFGELYRIDNFASATLIVAIRHAAVRPSAHYALDRCILHHFVISACVSARCALWTALEDVKQVMRDSCLNVDDAA